MWHTVGSVLDRERTWYRSPPALEFHWLLTGSGAPELGNMVKVIGQQSDDKGLWLRCQTFGCLSWFCSLLPMKPYETLVTLISWWYSGPTPMWQVPYQNNRIHYRESLAKNKNKRMSLLCDAFRIMLDTKLYICALLKPVSLSLIWEMIISQFTPLECGGKNLPLPFHNLPHPPPPPSLGQTLSWTSWFFGLSICCCCCCCVLMNKAYSSLFNLLPM